MALKKNTGTPDSTAKMYLSKFSKNKFVWQTMEPGRMANLFKSFLESGNVKPDTKQKVLRVLAENFV